jgi:light-regulated signal transduction histidine kinase (bacteriophytochrome)
VEQARELIDDELFLGELETGREVVSLGRTQAKPIVEDIVASFAERANHAEISLEVRADGRVELPLRPRMLRVVLENLVANAIRYAGPGSTCTVELTNPAEGPVLTVSDDGKGVEATDRHGTRPRDREARRHFSRRRGGGSERARPRARDPRPLSPQLSDQVTVCYLLGQWRERTLTTRCHRPLHRS